MTIDSGNVRWDQPLEAVHEDGRVVPVDVRSGPYGHGLGFYDVEPELEGDDGEIHFSFNNDGTHRFAKWTIRNVATPADMAPEAPETHRQGANGFLTGVEALECLEALTRRLAAHMNDDGTIDLVGIRETGKEAQAIVALLPPPTDPDLIEARGIAANHYGLAQKDGPYITGANDDFPAVRIALAGIKAGREMASPASDHRSK